MPDDPTEKAKGSSLYSSYMIDNFCPVNSIQIMSKVGAVRDYTGKYTYIDLDGKSESLLI